MKSYSDTTIVIPTINEEGNIGVIINRLTKSYPDIRIIVADDGSRDKTKEIVGKISRKNRNVSFFDRSKERVHGLTISVVDSARIVKTEKIIVMDADLQHPVDKVGPISKALDTSDLVVGTRTSVKDWGIRRRIISKGITILSLAVFKIKGKHTTKDMMSGFFGIRTKLLKELAENRRSEFVDEGYKVMLDILRILDKEKSVSEVYYSTFHGREKGESKLRTKHIIATLISTLK